MIPFQTDPESIEKTKKRILLILDKYSASRKTSTNKKKKKSKRKQKDTLIVCPFQRSIQPIIDKEQKSEMILSARRIKKDIHNLYQSNLTKKASTFGTTQQLMIMSSQLPKNIESYENDNQSLQMQKQTTKNKQFKPKSPKEKASDAIRAPRNMDQKRSDQKDLQKTKDENTQTLQICRKTNQKNKRSENSFSNIIQINEKQVILNSPKNVKKGQIFYNPIALPDFGDDDDDLNDENLPIISDLPVEKPFISHSYFDFTKSASGRNLTIDLNHPIYSTSSCNVFISKDDSNPPVYYAIKSSSFISRLEREFSIYNLIGWHPSIISCYDLWTDEGTAFMHLELSQKGSIRSNLFTFNNNQIWQIFSHIIFALKKLHSIGYIHLDISPSNILQCRSSDDSLDVYKLSDFGMSIPIGSFEEDCDGAGPYLSPEALLFPDTEFDVGSKADIFSFGVVMLEIVSKRLAPRNCNNYKALRNGSFDFTVLCIPEEFSFIKDMLNPNPEKRPSAEQLASMEPVKKEIDKLIMSTNNIVKKNQILPNQIKQQQQKQNEKQDNQILPQTPAKQNTLQMQVKHNLMQSLIKQNTMESPKTESSMQSPTRHSSLQSSMEQNCHEPRRKLNLDDSFDSSNDNSPTKSMNGLNSLTNLSAEQLESNQLIQENSNIMKEQQHKIKTRKKQNDKQINQNMQQSPMKLDMHQIQRRLNLSDTFNSSDESSPANNKKESSGLELNASIIKEQQQKTTANSQADEQTSKMQIQQHSPVRRNLPPSPKIQRKLSFNGSFDSFDESLLTKNKDEQSVTKEIDSFALKFEEEQQTPSFQKQINFDDTYEYSDDFLFIKELNESNLQNNTSFENECESQEYQGYYKINNIFDPFVPYDSSDSYNTSDACDEDLSFCNVTS